MSTGSRDGWPDELVKMADELLFMWSAFMPFDQAERMLEELYEFVAQME